MQESDMMENQRINKINVCSRVSHLGAILVRVLVLQLSSYQSMWIRMHNVEENLHAIHLDKPSIIA